MIKKLANEFVKNIKIMFRNWTSLSLLIIAPLVLILLIGYAFSSDSLSGIKIGIISGEKMDLGPLAQSVRSYGSISQYDQLQSCLSDLALQKTHICVDIEGLTLNANQSNITNLETGKITYYYDDTRKKISLSIIRNIQEFFGLKAEQMSIESTQSIIENIQSLIGFINDRRGEIAQLKNESLQLKNDQIARKAKLEQVRSDFLPSYFAIKDTQATMHNYSTKVNATTDDIRSEIDLSLLLVRTLKTTASVLLPPELEDLGVNETENITTIITLLDDMEQRLVELQDLTDQTNADANSLVMEVDQIVGQIDNVKFMLDEEIIRTDASIKEIDKRVAQIEQISKDLDEKLSGLSALSPGMAEKLIRPLISDYGSLLKNVKNIQLTFPQLLVIIIMFIALLFSNIATLTEINDKAYIRNLISPVNDSVYVIGMLLTSIVIIFSQILVLFAVAQLKFGIVISSMFWQISAVSLLLVTVFILVGMIFAYLFRTIQSSVLVTTFSALIFFLFSNTLAPIEAMPSAARFISNNNPIVIGEFLVKEIQLFKMPLGVLTDKILLLAAYIAVLFIALIILAKIKNRKRE